MTLSEFQKSKCLQIIDKLISWPICSPFVDPVDPERDGAANYLEIIKEPMSLRVVQSRLNNDEIKTLDEFKHDVNLIWSNARLYNGEDTLFTQMSMEAKMWFEKKMKKFPSTLEEEWTRKIQNTTQKFLDILMHPPTEIIHNGKLNDSGNSNSK